MEEQEIIEKIDRFLNKEGLDIQSKFILTKKMSDEYWEEVLSEGDQEENDLLDELGEEEPEEQEEEIAAPKQTKKKKLSVKKTKVIAKIPEKKEETPKEQEEEDVFTE